MFSASVTVPTVDRTSGTLGRCLSAIALGMCLMLVASVGLACDKRRLVYVDSELT